MSERNCGILLHITSLPGLEGTGTLGNEALLFIDFLKNTEQKYWQILPLGPAGYGNSPYQCYSAFAGNPLLIDLHELKACLLLSAGDLSNIPGFNKSQIDFEKTACWKMPLLKKAFENFQKIQPDGLAEEYNQFLEEHNWWLQDFALYMSAKKYFKNVPWQRWDDELKFRDKKAVRKYSELLERDCEEQKFIQFLFFRQWFKIKHYANSKGIQIIGDLPLYVSGDSVDVWANTNIFQLGNDLEPILTGGVPPDYFSETGQLWGNPVYDWQQLKKRNFDWWMARLHFNLNLFDKVRIDHFRGLESFWAVPAGEKSAVNGRWIPAGGYQILSKFREQTGHLPFWAEDLGVITPEVESLRNHFNLPGMKVLQFAFSTDAKNQYLPHNYSPGFIAYTGTHDNNTTLGWLRSLKGNEKKLARSYLGNTNKKRLKNAIELIWSSCAETAVIPLQDLLMLGEKARMNRPGTSSGNWQWRFRTNQLKTKHISFLKIITSRYNRELSATS
ncbi:MAG: 4-alpha-glucanotransferase [Prolixibacteraceae bacterium]|nr:4-alpha-glucanotransferase [Prolixibacteraceae bacterium]MDD4756080.1 4-alpha-glucanotransferase [Prolixibacteraceae bacterium]